MRIIFVCHGSPDFNRSRKITPTGLQQALEEYTNSVVIEPPVQNLTALNIILGCKAAVSSELARSRASAVLLGFGNVVTSPL